MPIAEPLLIFLAVSDLSLLQNWLLITFDQWRGDWLHQSWLDLPNLRFLANSGWDVRRCYTSSPQCVPARASWLTGMSPGDLGVTHNKVYTVPNDAPSFVRELRDDYGYVTSLVGKTHWTPHQEGVDLRDNLSLLKDLGFDHVREIAGPRALAILNCELTDLWKKEGVLNKYRNDLEERYRNGCIHTVRPTVLPDHLYPDIWMTGVALEELSKLPVDQPWFLWISFPGPHEPFDVPSSWRKKNRNALIPSPESRPKDHKKLLELAPIGSELYRKLARWPDGIPAKPLIDLREDYVDHLGLLDSQVGEILRALFKRDDATRTAISVCSDHGELLGDWGLLLKGCFLEGAIRTLFIHRPPKGRNLIKRLWQPSKKPYGLTQLLWASALNIRKQDNISFGSYLRNTNQKVLIEFGTEKLTINS